MTPQEVLDRLKDELNLDKPVSRTFLHYYDRMGIVKPPQLDKTNIKTRSYDEELYQDVKLAYMMSKAKIPLYLIRDFINECDTQAGYAILSLLNEKDKREENLKRVLAGKMEKVA